MDAINELPFLESAKQRQEQIQQANRIFHAATCSNDQVPIAMDGRCIRPLTLTEVSTLRGPCFSKCQDWGKLRLMLNPGDLAKDHSTQLEELISFNTFSGVVVIGLTINTSEVGNDEEMLPPGIHYNALISNCILDCECRVYRNMCLSNTFVGDTASILNCGKISCEKEVSYGSMKLVVGPESGGGREMALMAESTMIDVCDKLGDSTINSSFICQPTTCDMNCIGAGCIVRDTPTIESILLAPNSRIEGATSVRNAVLFPTACVGNACTVHNAMLQWKASIMDHSYVSNTLLMEHAHAGPKSVVVNSILGPDVHVSSGEVHSSVIGPNTNAHHQSLVIGLLWPLGRGNVGYGANVGSNHTGRLPDQETCSGEGTFWGLSCVVKFPVDLSYSPYSIVAAGTTVGPQRIVMPFSLLVDVKGDTQIIPGWLLQSSPYTLTRNANKYANRRQATHHKFYTGWSIIRPDTVDLCWIARESLRGVSKLAAEYKTERVVPGIGSTTLTEKGRLSGVVAYTLCIQRYALDGLLTWIQSNRGSNLLVSLDHEMQNVVTNTPNMEILTKPSWPSLPWDKDKSSTWTHQKNILHSEFPRIGDWRLWLTDVLQRLVTLEADYANCVLNSKRRDDVRGLETIPGYKESHVAAVDDDVINGAKQEAHGKAKFVETILMELSSVSNPSRSRL